MKKLAMLLVLSLSLQCVTPLTLYAAEATDESVVSLENAQENLTETPESGNSRIVENGGEAEMPEKAETADDEASEAETSKAERSETETSETETDEALKNVETGREEEAVSGDKPTESDEAAAETETSESEASETETSETETSETEASEIETSETETSETEASEESIDNKASAAEIEGFIQEKYYKRENGYVLFIGVVMPDWDENTKELTDVSYQIDGGALSKLGTVPSDKFSYSDKSWASNVGRFLTISLDSMPSNAGEGKHALSVYFTAAGKAYKVTGNTEFVDDMLNKESPLEAVDTNMGGYISSKAGLENARISVMGYTSTANNK